MIEETARVIRREGDRIELETVSRSACGRCAARAGCGQPLLARVLGERTDNRLTLTTSSVDDAAPGDMARLGLEERDLLVAALLLYGLPTLSIVVGALVGQWMDQSDIGALLGALSGGVGGFSLSRLCLRRIGNPVRLLGVEPVAGSAGPECIAVKVL